MLDRRASGPPAWTDRREPERFEFNRATIIAPPEAPAADVEAGANRGGIIGEAVNLARELVNRHPGELYPETFARRAEQVATQFGLQCDILDELRLQQERMNSLLGVAQGSTRPPRVCGRRYTIRPSGSSMRVMKCGSIAWPPLPNAANAATSSAGTTSAAPRNADG